MNPSSPVAEAAASNAGPWSARWLGVVAIFVVVMTPLLAYLAPLGFAPLLALAGGLVLPSLKLTRAAAPPLLILVALVVWAAISMSWSPVVLGPLRPKNYGDIETLTALKLALQLATYGAAVVALRELPEAAAERAAAILAYALVGLAVLTALDAMMGAAIYLKFHTVTGEAMRPDVALVKVSLATYALALLFWPASLVLSRRHGPLLIILLLAGTIVTSKITSSDACLAALAAGGFAWLMVRYLGQLGAKVLVGLIAIPFVTAPLVVLVGVQTGVVAWMHRMLPASWDARLDIWTFAADHIQTHPFRGWGLDASRTFGVAIPLHTHNGELQLWLELGAVGAALAGVFFCWVAYGVVRLAQRSRSEAAMAAGALVSYLVIGAISFGVWQEWWIALGALTFIACGMARAGGENTENWGELTPLS